MTTAFDEIQFPLRAGYGSSGGPQFMTEVVTIAGGYERRNQLWSQPRRRYEARTGVKSFADAATLSAFFQARAGRARGFRLKDWNDYSSASDGISSPSFDDQILGTGDGGTTSFQLVKNNGSFARNIQKPVSGSILIGLGGVAQTSGWTVNATSGVVTFALAPASGSIVTAGFLFDVPVRFDTDILNLISEDGNLFQGEVPMVEIRA
jgi:uncharacterized protein (TIGR02217 family)